jgi:hypothetical protein
MKPAQMSRLSDLPRRDPAPSQGPGAALATAQTPRPGARPAEAPAASRAVAAASLPAQRGPR